MKVLIFGATGATGQCLLERALGLGHEVTAFARNPAAVVFQHARLSVTRGQNAVLCALGVKSFAATTVLSTGTRHIVAAMERAGTGRIVCESSLGVGDSRSQAGFIFGRIVLPLVFKRLFEDKERQERELRQSNLDWVIVRPAQLTNGPQQGKYRAVTDGSKVGTKISRADVAAFTIEQLTDDQYLRKTVAKWMPVLLGKGMQAMSPSPPAMLSP